MAKKKKGGHAGGHGWFVTFADLMGLLMSFFVMLTAYSTMDQKKLQMVAGSMAQAFGTLKESRFSGVVEIDGLPTRPNLKHVEHVDLSQATERPAPRAPNSEGTMDATLDRRMASAAASIRQALQASPEFTDLVSNLRVERTEEGLNVELIDQDGRSMFAGGSSAPNARTQAMLARIAPVLARLPNRIRITGHTAWGGLAGGGDADGPPSSHWRVSAGRAIAVRDALALNGVSDDRFEGVAGKADTEPLVADNPALAMNRRVAILLLDGAAPLPGNLKP